MERCMGSRQRATLVVGAEISAPLLPVTGHWDGWGVSNGHLGDHLHHHPPPLPTQTIPNPGDGCGVGLDGEERRGGGRASNKHQTLLCDCAEPSLTLLTLFKAGDNSPVNPKKVREGRKERVVGGEKGRKEKMRGKEEENDRRVGGFVCDARDPSG